jgi:hypothetical protein
MTTPCIPCISNTPVSPNAPDPCEGEPCPDVFDDACIVYTGPDFDCLGVKTNDRISSVLEVIMTKLCQIATNCCSEICLPPVIVSTNRTCSTITVVAGGADPLTSTYTVYIKETGGAYGAGVQLSLGDDTHTFTGLTESLSHTVKVEVNCPGDLGDSTSVEEVVFTLASTNAVMGPWGAWGACVDGIKTRTRVVLVPATCNGTTGDTSEDQEC